MNGTVSLGATTLISIGVIFYFGRVPPQNDNLPRRAIEAAAIAAAALIPFALPLAELGDFVEMFLNGLTAAFERSEWLGDYTPVFQAWLIDLIKDSVRTQFYRGLAFLIALETLGFIAIVGALSSGLALMLLMAQGVIRALGAYEPQEDDGMAQAIADAFARPAVRRPVAQSFLLLVGGVWLLPLAQDFFGDRFSPDFWTGIFSLPWAAALLLLGYATQLGRQPRQPPAPKTTAQPAYTSGYGPGVDRLWQESMLEFGDIARFAARPAPSAFKQIGQPPPASRETRHWRLLTTAIDYGADRDWATNGLADDLRSLDEGGVAYVTDTLQSCYLSLISELAALSQDRGKRTLLVLPDIDADAVMSALNPESGPVWRPERPVQAERYIGLGHSPAAAGAGEPAPVTCAILLAPQSQLRILFDGFLASTEYGPNGDFGRFDQIVLLNLQDLDVPFIRLQFARMADYRSIVSRRIRLLGQASGFDDLSVAVGELYNELMLLDAPPDPLNLTFRRAVDTQKRWHYWVVWRGGRDAARSIRRALPGAQREMSPEVALTTWIEQWRNEHQHVGEFAIIDREGQVDLRQSDQSQQDSALSNRNRRVAAASLDALDEAAEERVLLRIVQDDLHAALTERYDASPNQRVLVNLLAEQEAPLHAFMLDLLLQGEAPSGPAELDRLWPLLSPKPRGGVKELLTTLNGVLARTPGRPFGVSREDAELRFLAQLPNPIREALEITPTAGGVQRLFRRFVETEIRPSVLTERDPHLPAKLYMSSPIDDPALELDTQVASDDVRIRVSDANLLFLEEQTIILGNRRLRLDRIDRGRPIWQPLDFDAGATLMQYQNVISYQLETRASDAYADIAHISMAEPRHWNRNAAAYRSTFLAVSFQRLTHGFYATPKGAAWFVDGRRHDAFGSTTLPGGPRSRSQLFQAAWRLRIEPREPFSEDELPTAAFMLAIVFQDVLRSLFRRHRHRLQVVALEAAKLQRVDVRDLPDTPLDLLRAAYPRLELTGPLAKGRFPWDDAPDDAPQAINLLVLEDSDMDLGLVRALFDYDDELIGKITQYVSWLRRSDWRSSYHSFGMTGEAGAIPFELLDRLFPEPNETAPPKPDTIIMAPAHA